MEAMHLGKRTAKHLYDCIHENGPSMRHTMKRGRNSGLGPSWAVNKVKQLQTSISTKSTSEFSYYHTRQQIPGSLPEIVQVLQVADLCSKGQSTRKAQYEEIQQFIFGELYSSDRQEIVPEIEQSVMQSTSKELNWKDNSNRSDDILQTIGLIQGHDEVFGVHLQQTVGDVPLEHVFERACIITAMHRTGMVQLDFICAFSNSRLTSYVVGSGVKRRQGALVIQYFQAMARLLPLMERIRLGEVPLKAIHLLERKGKSRQCSVCTRHIMILFRRRHHCLQCGQIVCSRCAPQRSFGMECQDSFVVDTRVCTTCVVHARNLHVAKFENSMDGISTASTRSSSYVGDESHAGVLLNTSFAQQQEEYLTITRTNYSKASEIPAEQDSFVAEMEQPDIRQTMQMLLERNQSTREELDFSTRLSTVPSMPTPLRNMQTPSEDVPTPSRNMQTSLDDRQTPSKYMPAPSDYMTVTEDDQEAMRELAITSDDDDGYGYGGRKSYFDAEPWENDYEISMKMSALPSEMDSALHYVTPVEDFELENEIEDNPTSYVPSVENATASQIVPSAKTETSPKTTPKVAEMKTSPNTGQKKLPPLPSKNVEKPKFMSKAKLVNRPAATPAPAPIDENSVASDQATTSQKEESKPCVFRDNLQQLEATTNLRTYRANLSTLKRVVKSLLENGQNTHFNMISSAQRGFNSFFHSDERQYLQNILEPLGYAAFPDSYILNGVYNPDKSLELHHVLESL